MNPRYSVDPAKRSAEGLDKALSRYLAMFMNCVADDHKPPNDAIIIARCQKLIAEYRRRYGRAR
jgi:hypothetical protein